MKPTPMFIELLNRLNAASPDQQLELVRDLQIAIEVFTSQSQCKSLAVQLMDRLSEAPPAQHKKMIRDLKLLVEVFTAHPEEDAREGTALFRWN